MMNKEQLKELLKARIDLMVDVMEELQPGFDLCDLKLEVSRNVDDQGNEIPEEKYVIRSEQYATANLEFFTEAIDAYKLTTDTNEIVWLKDNIDFEGGM